MSKRLSNYQTDFFKEEENEDFEKIIWARIRLTL